MSYQYSYVGSSEPVLEALAAGGSGLFSSGLIGIAAYVFTAFALYTLATNRGLSKPWLAWIPVVNVWILGSLSDQYRYVVKNQEKSKRKVLVVLSACQLALRIVVLIFAVVVMGVSIFGAMSPVSNYELMNRLKGPLIGALVAFVPFLGVSLAYTIFYYMSLYDVYCSCDPRNSTVYLVLSIIPGISTVAQPLFLFLCRDKDGGMPPRREPQPVYEQPRTPGQEAEPWEASAEQEPWEYTQSE